MLEKADGSPLAVFDHPWLSGSLFGLSGDIWVSWWRGSNAVTLSSFNSATFNFEEYLEADTDFYILKKINVELDKRDRVVGDCMWKNIGWDVGPGYWYLRKMVNIFSWKERDRERERERDIEV